MKKCFVFICIFVMSLSGCQKEEAVEMIERDPVKIGLIFDTFVVERWQRDRDSFVSTAKEMGAEVDVQNANGDPEKQVEQIDYFIEQKVDVIVIVPIEDDVLIMPVKKARNAGIRVIAYDRPIYKTETDLYISFDNEMVGTLMGEALASNLEKGNKVLMVCGPVSDNNVTQVNKGFQQVMEEQEIEILDITYTEGWKAERAAAYIDGNFEKVEQVKGIMCGNDNIAAQVIHTLAERRLAGSIYVTGQDGDLDACQRIVEGVQYMTVYKPVDELAKQAAQIAVGMALGEQVEVENTIKGGGEEIPYIKLEPRAVTVENMDETIIESGFHLKEDIYMNQPKMQ